jgi:hypothetical protein
MRKPIIILIILPIFVLFSGCKNSKESNETSDKDWNIKNSKLFDYHWYNPSEKEFVIKYSNDFDFLDDISQEEIEEYIDNLLCFIEITEPNFF